MEVTVVVPVRDEVDNVAPLALELQAALEGRFDYEVVYVDDGSTDGTIGRLQEIRGEFPRMRVLRLRHACGKSAAIRAGILAAAAPIIATIDGDCQDDPTDIPRLVEVLLESASPSDIVCGRRVGRRDSAVRRLSSRCANTVRAALLRDETLDTACGLKAFRRDLFLALPYFDNMHRFLPALVRREGGRSFSLDVRNRPRLRGYAKYGVGNRLWVGIADLFGVMWLRTRRRRADVEELRVDAK